MNEVNPEVKKSLLEFLEGIRARVENNEITTVAVVTHFLPTNFISVSCPGGFLGAYALCAIGANLAMKALLEPGHHQTVPKDKLN